MATEVHEIERKYDADVGVRLPDLSDLPEVSSQAGPDEQILEATYYDTEGLDLVRAGITLRQRLGGDDPGWHLKLPVASDARTELHLPHAPEPPQELLDLLTARLRGRSVRPVARITTTRLRHRLSGRDGTTLAEVVIDDVTAEALGPEATLSRWNEVEFELSHGGPALLKAADRRLRESGLRRAGHTSKLRAALAARLPEPAADPDLGGSSSAGDVVLAYLREQREELLANDVLVRRDQPDAVHQMRVATRRLRSALRSFDALFPRDEATQIGSELHWLAGLLGEARDVEVLRDRLLAQVAALPVESVLGPVPARITGHFAPQYAAARARLLEALSSTRYLALLDQLDALLAQPPTTPAAGKRARKSLAALVRHEMKRPRRRMRRAAEAPAGERRDVALHEARKAVKRARYVAEVVAPAFGRDARRTASSLKKAQTLLGDHQDAVIARAASRQLALRAHADRENAFTYGLLYELQAEQAAASRKRARKAWEKASSKKRTAWTR